MYCLLIVNMACEKSKICNAFLLITMVHLSTARNIYSISFFFFLNNVFQDNILMIILRVSCFEKVDHRLLLMPMQ